MKRPPAVAGMFYPSTEEELRREIERCFLHPLGPGRLPERRYDGETPPILISPHAGYMYSGPVAAHGYLQLEDRRRPSTVIVVGPNHYGIGTQVSIYPGGEWVTPLGSVPIDMELGVRLTEISDIFSMDEVSHSREHSIEVQVPFLQYVLGEFRFLPICILDQSLPTCLEVGRALAEILKERDDILLVASTDFTHYEPHEYAAEKDGKALEAIKSLSPERMYEVIERFNVSMCGYGPVAAVLEAAREIGSREATLLKYATSGDVTGDRSSVVGYASLKIERPR